MSSEYDNSSFRKGISEMVADILKTIQAQKELQAEFTKTGENLETVKKEIGLTKAELEKLTKSEKGAGDAAEQLQQKVEDLTATNGNLSVAYKKQQAELEKNKALHDNLTKAISQTETTTKKVQETFSKKTTPNVDISQISAAAAKLNQLKASFGAGFDNVANMFHPAELSDLDERLIGVQGEFKEIATQVGFLSEKLTQLEPGTQQFEDLAAAIRVGNTVLKEYQTAYNEATKAVEGSEPAYKSIRARLAEYRKELDLLEGAGKEETAEFRQVQLAAARLADQYGDMQQQIQILASDTKYLDFGLSAINAAGAGFQAAEGIMTLFGVSSEDAAKAQAKLLAIMSIVQGLQQLQNLLLKENIIQTVGAKIATETYALSQKVLAATLGSTVAASKAANAALITTGVGALIVGLGYLISKIIEWTDVTDKAKKANEALEESIKRQQQYISEDIDMIDLGTRLRSEKIKQRGDNERLIYEAGQQAYVSKVQYYNDQLQKLQAQYDRADLAGRLKIGEEQRRISDEAIKLKEQNILVNAQETTRLANEEYARLQRANQLRQELALKYNWNNQEQQEMINLKATYDKEIEDLQRRGLSTVEVEQLYQVKRQEIIDNYARLRLAKEQELRKDISLIGKTEEQQAYINLQFEHDRELKEIIRMGENRVLFEQLYQRKAAEVKQKFDRLRAEEEKSILQDLDKLSLQLAEARVENIQDQFKKETEAIKVEALKQREALQQAQTDELDALLKNKIAGLVPQELFDSTVKEINDKFNGLFDQLDAATTNRNRELGSKILQGTIQAMNNSLSIATNGISIQASEAIKKAATMYVQGKLNFTQYQQALTKIEKQANLERLQDTQKALENEIKLIQQRLLGDITKAEHDALELQLSDLQKQLAENGAEQAAQTATNLKTERDKHYEHLQKVLELYSNFTNIVGGFLDQLSQQEQQRLDRSIAIQQQRVDYAKEIASKGNAEYLELEQKRLDELQRKREEAARKQLAIDQALRVSQATVAAISAIASAAATGDPFAAVAAGIAVLGAIAAAYAFVSSLEAPTPEFFEGTTFVEGEGGRDKIKAKVTRGEAIIPVDKNEKYKNAVEAIYYEKIPAEVLNSFVANYPAVSYPTIDYSRLGGATDRHIMKNSEHETTSRLDKINSTMQQVVEGLSNLNNFQLNLDENGFALSILTAMNTEKLKWLN
jgi:hypothetical protein